MNAPPPFRRNSLAQTVVWDGKDDRGRYVDDKPRCVVRVSLGLKPRSIGGDEVGLSHACYVAAHSDRRLVVADIGNARIVSVRLGYYATERVPLRAVADRGCRAPGP